MKITIKYVPTVLSDDANLSYDVLAIETNKEYLQETLEEYISVDLVKEIQEEAKKLAVMVVESTSIFNETV